MPEVEIRKIIKSQNLVTAEEETRLTELEAKMETLRGRYVGSLKRTSWASEKPATESHQLCSHVGCHIQRSVQGRLDGSSIVTSYV
jgi:hypothetical protein